MSWNKIKWSSALILVFLLLLATNLIDRKNFKRINESMVSIYSDRLVVNGFVYHLSELIHEKNKSVLTANESFYKERNEAINQEIDEIVIQFYETKLTPDEKINLDAFSKKIRELKAIEDSLSIKPLKLFEEPIKTALLEQMSKIDKDLNILSKIQLDEGRRQYFISKEALESIELLTKLEVYALVIIALFVLLIIFYKPSASSIDI